MPSSSEYQVYVHECLRWAEKAGNDEDWRAFFEMGKGVDAARSARE